LFDRGSASTSRGRSAAEAIGSGLASNFANPAIGGGPATGGQAPVGGGNAPAPVAGNSILIGRASGMPPRGERPHHPPHTSGPQAPASNKGGADTGSSQDLGLPPTAAPAAGGKAPLAISQNLTGLPTTFVENRGQWATPAQFVASSGPVTALFADHGIRLQIAG